MTVNTARVQFSLVAGEDSYKLMDSTGNDSRLPLSSSRTEVAGWIGDYLTANAGDIAAELTAAVLDEEQE